MAGKIIADTLEHSTAGSIATNYVVDGLSKAMGFVNPAGSTYKSGSLNISSVTDNGASGKVFSFTSNFSTQPNCSIGESNVGLMAHGGGAFNFSSGGSSSGITLQYYNASSYVDTYASLLAAGDLA